MTVLVAWDSVASAEPLVREVVTELTGYDPGPLHHTCPQCGRIEHGRPYVDAPVEVSVSHAPNLTAVAVSEAGPVGIDVADTEEWARREAIGKAYGVGLLVDEPGPAWVTTLPLGDLVAAVALVNGAAAVRVVGHSAGRAAT